MSFNARKHPSKSTNDSDRDVVELYVWGGGWGLPSVDPESLQALAVTRFGGAPAKIIECNNPWKSPNGSLPFFKHRQPHGDQIFYTARDLANHLRLINYSCDYGLSPKQCADVVAFGEYVIEALHPAMQYFCWLHNSNFEHTIRPFYGTRLPWLYKMWYPDRKLQKKARDLIITLYPDAVEHPDVCEPYILQKAQACIALLSEKLGTNDFFMLQKTPSSIDGLIYSYLAPFLKIPISHCPIREYIVGANNLERFVARITTRYLSTGAQGDSDQSRASSSKSSGGPQGVGHGGSFQADDNSTTRKLLTFAFGIGAMIFYAYKIGLVHLPREKKAILYDHGPEDDDEEDEEFD